MNRRCDTCEYWRLVGEGQGREEEGDQDEYEGHCRRHAPTPVHYGLTYEVLKHLTHLSWHVCTEEERKSQFTDWEESMLRWSHAWPLTESQDWCGDWRQISAEAGVTISGSEADADASLNRAELVERVNKE